MNRVSFECRYRKYINLSRQKDTEIENGGIQQGDMEKDRQNE